MKNRILKHPFIALFILLFVQANAQGWERIYYSDLTNPISADLYSAANKGFVEDDGSFLFAAIVQGQNQFIWTDSNGYITNSVNTLSSTRKMIRADDQNFVIASRLNSNTSPANEDVKITKFDVQGNLIWEHHPEGYLFGNEAVSDFIQSSDGAYVIVGARANPPAQQAASYISKVAEDGTLLWKQIGLDLPATNVSNYYVVETSDGGYFMVGSSAWFTSNNPLLTDARKLDQDGNLEWMGSLETDFQVSDMFIAPDGSIVLSGNTVNFENALRVINDNGETLWETTFTLNNSEPTNIVKCVATNDGGYAVLVNVYGEQNDLYLLKLDSNGNEEWVQSYGGALDDSGQDVLQLEDNGFLIVGAANIVDESAGVYLIRTDERGNSISNLIEGQVRYDTNENCIVENEEQALENWIVSATNAGGIFYGSVDESGHYSIDVGAETFEVVMHEPNDYWSTCVDSVMVDATANATVDFAEQSIEQCPLMEVSVQTGLLRLCEQATVTVFYENQGTALAQDAYVEVVLADSLSLVDASVAYTDLGNNSYSFDIGDVDFLTNGSFNITVQVGCDISLMGQSMCIDAHIYPDESCLDPDPAWSGASIAVSGECTEGEVNFVIENVGAQDMTEALHYTVIEDHVIMLQGQSYGPLAAGQSITIPKPANGTFYRLESEQVANHPGAMSMPSAFIEACGTAEDGSVSLGFVNQFPLNDGAPYLDINCTEVVAAYDPNVKEATPIGFENEHFIRANTSIDYTIRFQNTGTAPANQVILHDQLSKDLDPTTINLGASSHDFDFELLANGLIRFTFNDIALPDSTTNEPASHGFVSFTIDQQKDLAIGTVIENSAAIFFDFNPAIITNTTYHTIGENFITVNVGEVLAKDVNISVSPNPFSALATIYVEAENTDDLNIRVFDASGKELIRDQFSSANYELRADHLAKGIHFYQIRQAGVLINSGKLVVQ